MTAVAKKMLVAGTLLLGAVGYLAYAGAKSSWVYFVDVDKVATDPSLRAGRVRVHGKVSPENFVSSAGAMKASFIIAGKTQSIPVSYTGAIPDQFATGREVVVEGTFDNTGTFKADVLMTKCASKYDSDSPHATDAGGARHGEAAKGGKELPS